MPFDMPPTNPIPASNTSDLQLGSDAELSDELQLLAEQLGEDAIHLSTLYPAQSPDKWASTASAAPPPATVSPSSAEPATAGSWSPKRAFAFHWTATTRATVQRTILAASLLLAVGLAGNFWPENNGAAPQPPSPSASGEPVAHQTPPEIQTRPTETLVIHPVNKHSDDHQLVSKHPASKHPTSKEPSLTAGALHSEPVAVSTGLFMTFSSSEQEALLDLMEDENLPQPSVSF